MVTVTPLAFAPMRFKNIAEARAYYAGSLVQVPASGDLAPRTGSGSGSTPGSTPHSHFTGVDRSWMAATFPAEVVFGMGDFTELRDGDLLKHFLKGGSARRDVHRLGCIKRCTLEEILRTFDMTAEEFHGTGLVRSSMMVMMQPVLGGGVSGGGGDLVAAAAGAAGEAQTNLSHGTVGSASNQEPRRPQCI